MNQTREHHHNFVRQYIAARRKEHRLYADDEVLQLPYVSPSHVLYDEWRVRKWSAEMLVKYLSKKKRALRILEVGCGNGWLSAAMAAVEQSSVVGIDINDVELHQATEVFNQWKNVQFIYATIDEMADEQQRFDIIVFAASIQYFPSVNRVIKTAASLLSNGGEIHILDTHLYKEAEIEVAKKRTYEYYTALGFPGMSLYYYHHSLSDFSSFNFAILFAPSFFQRRILRNPHPFYWIKIKEG